MNGHNVFVFGRAGTGKSYIVLRAVEQLKKVGKRVVVLCSSGIACDAYTKNGIHAQTVHSCFDMQTSELPTRKIITRAIANPRARQTVWAGDVFIWDECSMSSRRMLELVNAILHQLCDNEAPFGSKQFVFVREFFQPSSFDRGEFMFLSELWDTAVCHRIELTKPMRQNEEELMS